MTAIKTNAAKVKATSTLQKKAKEQARLELAAEAKLAAENNDQADASAGNGSMSGASSNGSSDGGGIGSGALILGAVGVLGGIAAVAAGGGDDVTVTPPPPPPPPPTYTVSGNAAPVNEGSNITFTINGTNANGQTVNYQITGLDDADVKDPSRLTGQVTIVDGKAEITIETVADGLLEGPQTATITVGGKSYSVTLNDTSVPVAPEVRTLSLTADADEVEANVFNSSRVLVGGTGYLNTLDDDDVLTGAGVNPTLNVAFGAENDISDSAEVQPELNGVQTINAEWQNGDTTDLNLADADDALTAVNVDRISSANASRSIEIDDIGASVTSLSVGDEVNGGRLTFDYREDELTGDEELTLKLAGARLNSLALSEDGDSNEDTGYFFETINIAASGTTDIDSLTIAANKGSDGQELNITAGAAAGAAGDLEINVLNASGVDTMSIVANQDVVIASDSAAVLSASNGLNADSLDQLTISGGSDVRIDGLGINGSDELTVSAGTMTGDLQVGVQLGTAGSETFSLTSGSGDDVVALFGSLGGDLVTNGGDDTVKFGSAASDDFLATASVSTGAGVDSVTGGNLAAVSDAEIVGNSSFGQALAASIDTGDGNDKVAVENLLSATDYNNGSLIDAQSDDTFFVKGASISTGTGDDEVSFLSMAEGASVSTGAGADKLTVSLVSQSGDVLAADGSTTAPAGLDASDEVDADGTLNVFGAKVDLGAGADTATFAEAAESDGTGFAAFTIVGVDAVLDGGADADTLNVEAYDVVTVAAASGDGDTNATVLGFETLNLTILNQVSDTSTVEVKNDDNVLDGQIIVDVRRFDADLKTINLVSQEDVLQTVVTNEAYQAGTETEFTLTNLRTGINLTLEAQEATGVASGEISDDALFAISSETGAYTANGSASDVSLNLAYSDATGLSDAEVLTVAASSGAFDLDLNITNTASSAVEKVTVVFQDDNSHSIDANGFGDNDFTAPTVSDDVSSTSVNSFAVWTGAGAGETIAIDNVNADSISVMNAAGSAVTAADVVLRVDDSNNYTITTGSGDDIVDMRSDDVRADDGVTAVNRADTINLGTGRDTLIVNGSDDIGGNNLVTNSDADSSVVDDDVFKTMTGVEKILIDADAVTDGVLDVTLDEMAAVTGVDTLALAGAGSDDQTLNLVIGNNFTVATTADNANGETTSAADALLLDASLHQGFTQLNIENKDDDTDVQKVNLDIRVNSQNAANINIVDTGGSDAVVQLTILTAGESDAFTLSDAVVTTTGSDGTVGLQVHSGSVDKIIIDDQLISNDGGSEAAMVITISDDWTLDGGRFELDASGVLDTDSNSATGGATIDWLDSDGALFTVYGTQNGDTIMGGDNSDTIYGEGGSDTITGNGGTDILYGGAGSDTITGGDGSDTIYGDAKDDGLVGSGNDILGGGAGNDTIYGGDGSDSITGGAGADNLYGGAGRDTFIYGEESDSQGATIDTIFGFQGGSDGDVFDFTAIAGTDDDVTFLGSYDTFGAAETALGGSASDGDLNVVYVKADHAIYVDANDDGTINGPEDMVIYLDAATFTGTLTQANFGPFTPT